METTDPNHPKRITSLSFGSVDAIALYSCDSSPGATLYFAVMLSARDEIILLDIGDPEQPRYVSRYQTISAQGQSHYPDKRGTIYTASLPETENTGWLGTQGG